MNRLEGAAEGVVLPDLCGQLEGCLSHRLQGDFDFAGVKRVKGSAEIGVGFFDGHGPGFVVEPRFGITDQGGGPFFVSIMKQIEGFIKKQNSGGVGLAKMRSESFCEYVHKKEVQRAE